MMIHIENQLDVDPSPRSLPNGDFDDLDSGSLKLSRERPSRTIV
jgi:hypothetical protein